MDIEGYFRSLHAEFTGLRDRVRYLIGDAHWPTDGGWKESVLRTALRRALGNSLEVGQGFFAHGDQLSRQCDVLIWQSDSPVLFRDGNLAVVPARAVRAIVEVKTRLDSVTMDEGFASLRESADVLSSREDVLLGLFAYETAYHTNEPVLRRLREQMSDPRHIVNLVCYGPKRFVRYWHKSPGPPYDLYERWHSYLLPNLSFAYCVANIVSHLSPGHYDFEGEPFFPRDGKERYKDGDRSRAGNNQEHSESVDFELDNPSTS